MKNIYVYWNWMNKKYLENLIEFCFVLFFLQLLFLKNYGHHSDINNDNDGDHWLSVIWLEIIIFHPLSSMKTNELIVNNIPFSKKKISDNFHYHLILNLNLLNFRLVFFFTNEWKSITNKKEKLDVAVVVTIRTKTDLKLKMEKKNKKKKNSNW